MNKECIKYLKYMSRHGLDARVLQEYQQCGMLYFSKRTGEEHADIDRFVDFVGVSRMIIKKVDELERVLGVNAFHIIWNSSKEIVIMCFDNDIDHDFQYEEFMSGTCQAIRYNIREDTYDYSTVHYDVCYGAVIDTDYFILS